MVARGSQALEVWARRVTAGYPGVRLVNMTSAWRDGLAFCAIIHSHRPDLIDFASLDARQVEANCQLAFDTAEQELGVPALLDPADMAACSSPDRLSILTYLSELYHRLHEASPSQVCSSPSITSSSTNNTPARKPIRRDSSDSGIEAASICSTSPVSSSNFKPDLRSRSTSPASCASFSSWSSCSARSLTASPRVEAAVSSCSPARPVSINPKAVGGEVGSSGSTPTVSRMPSGDGPHAVTDKAAAAVKVAVPSESGTSPGTATVVLRQNKADIGSRGRLVQSLYIPTSQHSFSNFSTANPSSSLSTSFSSTKPFSSFSSVNPSSSVTSFSTSSRSNSFFPMNPSPSSISTRSASSAITPSSSFQSALSRFQQLASDSSYDGSAVRSHGSSESIQTSLPANGFSTCATASNAVSNNASNTINNSDICSSMNNSDNYYSINNSSSKHIQTEESFLRRYRQRQKRVNKNLEAELRTNIQPLTSLNESIKPVDGSLHAEDSLQGLCEQDLRLRLRTLNHDQKLLHSLDKDSLKLTNSQMFPRPFRGQCVDAASYRSSSLSPAHIRNLSRSSQCLLPSGTPSAAAQQPRCLIPWDQRTSGGWPPFSDGAYEGQSTLV